VILCPIVNSVVVVDIVRFIYLKVEFGCRLSRRYSRRLRRSCDNFYCHSVDIDLFVIDLLQSKLCWAQKLD